jgi:hypothetical protein
MDAMPKICSLLDLDDSSYDERRAQSHDWRPSPMQRLWITVEIKKNIR